jgi:SAM-dependent methyltransferase
VEEPCDICGSTLPFIPYLHVSVAAVFDAVIVLCPGCGFRQIRPRPTRDELAACYADDYFDSDADAGFRDYARQQQRHEREAWFLARELRRLAATGRLLEVGSALGFLLEALQRFCDWECEGLDLSAFGVQFARERLGVAARQGTLRRAEYPDGAFDYVVQKDLLEHVARPREHLLETARILKPGGRLWLVTPNGEANLRPLKRLSERDLYGRPDLLPLLEQAHVSFFTRPNLLRLFDECGFQVLRLRSVGIKRGMRSLGMLPAKRQPPVTEAGRGRGGTPLSEAAPASTDTDPAHLDRLTEAMAADLVRHHRPVRSRPAYFRWRRLQERLDSLPGRLAWGVDFDILLERR